MMKKMLRLGIAIVLLSKICLSQKLDEINIPENDFKNLEKSCGTDNPMACAKLGDFYRTGDGVEVDLDRASYFFGKACDGKISGACYNRARLSFDGQKSNKNYSNAFKYSKKGCDLNDGGSCWLLAVIYNSGYGVKADIEKGRFYLKKSCEAGEVSSCEMLRKLGGLEKLTKSSNNKKLVTKNPDTLNELDDYEWDYCMREVISENVDFMGKSRSTLGGSDSSKNFYAQAMINLGVGNRKAASEHIESAVKFVPSDPNAILCYSIILLKEGYPDKAIAALDQLGEFSKVEVLTNKGAILLALGAYQEAIENFQKVLSIKQNDKFALVNMGLAYGKQGNYTKSYDYFTQALKQNDRFIYAHVNIGVLKGKQGEHIEAIDKFNHALRLNDEYSSAYLNLAFSYKKMGRLEDAKKAFAQYIQWRGRYF